MKAIGKKLLVEQSQFDDAAVAALHRLGLTETTHFIRWSEGTTVGAVAIEAGMHANSTGTWAPVQTVVFSGVAPKHDYVRVPGVYRHLRHRIVVPLNDGATVTTVIEGTV